MSRKSTTAVSAAPVVPPLVTRFGAQFAAVPVFIDRPTVAQILGVSSDHVIRLTAKGVLRSYKFGRSVRFKYNEVLAAAESCAA